MLKKSGLVYVSPGWRLEETVHGFALCHTQLALCVNVLLNTRMLLTSLLFTTISKGIGIDYGIALYKKKKNTTPVTYSLYDSVIPVLWKFS